MEKCLICDIYVESLVLHAMAVHTRKGVWSERVCWCGFLGSRADLVSHWQAEGGIFEHYLASHLGVFNGG